VLRKLTQAKQLAERSMQNTPREALFENKPSTMSA